MLDELGIDRTGHGWDGWLQTEKALPRGAFRDRQLMRDDRALGRDGAGGAAAGRSSACPGSCAAPATPTTATSSQANADGVRYTPLTTRDHRRVGARERLLEVAERYPDRLSIELDALATRVLFDERNRAVGVEYLKGERLYRAHAAPERRAGRAAQGARARAR